MDGDENPAPHGPYALLGILIAIFLGATALYFTGSPRP